MAWLSDSRAAAPYLAPKHRAGRGGLSSAIDAAAIALDWGGTWGDMLSPIQIQQCGESMTTRRVSRTLSLLLAMVAVFRVGAPLSASAAAPLELKWYQPEPAGHPWPDVG
jgi:hypothetical protein